MRRAFRNIVAITLIATIMMNIFGLIGETVYADVAPVDKLLANEKLINIEDKSYSYTDMKTHWAKDGVLKLSYMEVIKGFPDGSMRPDKTLTREEFIVMLVRALDLPLPEVIDNNYEDIDATHWGAREIVAAKNAGLLNIYYEAKLYPTKTISREHMTVIASNAVKDINVTVPGKSFTDINSEYRFIESLNRVTALGIINGMPNGSFKPYSGATRAEASVIIQRILDLKNNEASEDGSQLLVFAENYEKSRLLNPTVGTYSNEEILQYSLGKEQKQNLMRTDLINILTIQNNNLERNISDLNANITYSSMHLTEVSMNYLLEIKTQDGFAKSYPVTRKLFMKKTLSGWVVYNTSATFSSISNDNSGKKINLAWQLLGKSTPDMSNVAKIQGLNVVSPTWFTLDGTDGTMKSIGNQNYSNWAHQNGYQVWGLVTNDFDRDLTSKMLANPTARAKAVNSLIQYAKDYKMDGINVDFEFMYAKDKDLFTQFVKELYQKTKPLGIVLSVDVTVIVAYSDWSSCYDRKALAQVSDYIALMAYDQHWSGSPISGSVAQISWVEQHLKKVLLEVPKEKLLLGMPFYTRVWKEQYDANGKLVVSSSAVSMSYAEKLVADNKATKTWDVASGQYFASYKKDGATYKIWLEDERSIQLRVDLTNKYNLAGVASWKMGFEKPGIWDIITANLNKTVASR